MKNILLILFLAITTISVKAQDIIRLKSGEEMKVLIVDVSEKEIQYKKTDNINGPIYAVTMDQVASYSKNPPAGTNADDQLKTLVEQLKLLQDQIKRDSIYLANIKAKQDSLASQNQVVSESISQLGKKISNNADSSQKSLKQQHDVMTQQQDTIEKRINQMSITLGSMNNLLIESTTQQIKKTWIPKSIGIGIDVSGLIGLGKNTAYGDLYGDLSSNVLFLSYTPNTHFRIETEFAALLTSGSGSSGGDYYFALGLLGMKQRESANFYAGAKIRTFGIYSIFVPTFGGEYIFGNRFSVGSEIGLEFATTPSSSKIGVAFNRIIFRYYLFDDVKSSNKPSYTNSITPSNSTQPTTQSSPNPPVKYDCAYVKNGKFRMGNNVITRDGNKQTQINSVTGQQIEYFVVWLSDCEYELTKVDDATRKINVKILSVDSEGYYCSYSDSADRQTYKARMDKEE